MDTNLPNLADLTKLLDSLEADPAPPPERRKYARRLAAGIIHVLVQTEDGHPPRTGTLRDMSRSGIGIRLPNPLPINSHFTFRATVGPKAVRATCRVANCRPDGPHAHIIGAEILQTPAATSPAPAADVDQLHLTEVARRLQTTLTNPR